MTNNDVIRRVRYTFDLSDDQMITVFELGDLKVTRAQVSDWLKKDDDPQFQSLYDKELATFLNGFIILKRGRKEGDQPKPEKTLNNNIVLRKLKIALDLKNDDVIEILELVDFKIGKHELSAFFRKPTQNQYRPCKDQFLRNFLKGMQIIYRKGV
jgi:uncharacterized protein YehS (DUF1456 family)